MTTSAAASPPQKLSQEQVRDVRDTLKNPLTGQQVLVPLGNKAFFPGTLCPAVASDGEEQVVVRDRDGNDKEMTRQQALDCLQVEMDALKPPSRTKPVTMKSALKKSGPSSTASKQPASASAPMMNSALPYFEIREEYNDSGQNIAAQAINVSRELEYLQTQAAGESVVHIPPESKQDDVDVPDDDQGGREEVRVEPLKSINEEEYSNLAARLDELERLEEEASRVKVVNPKIKSLRGKGWSKGFLNNNKKSAPKKILTPNTMSISTSSQIPTPSPTKASTQKPAPAMKAPTTERRVAFHAEDQVKEIPRVGERSISEVRKPAVSRSVSEVRKPAASRPNRPIEESVFSGVVRERGAAPSAPRQEEAAPKKKLSRFAQQRQENR